MLYEWLLYSALGAIAGFFAGLLGVGGGLIIVPTLIFTFSYLNFPPEILIQLAVGSALATIFFTATSSVKAHHAAKYVHWPTVAKLAPGLATGAFIGGWATHLINSTSWNASFGVFCWLIAAKMAISWQSVAQLQMPSWPWLTFASLLMGVTSSLFGIGGGALIVPFLNIYQIPIKQAIGISSACGLLIAIGGSIGYIHSGWQNPLLPRWSLGFIYLPALIGIILTSTLFAQLGARSTHKLPAKQVKKIFSLLLLTIGGKFIFF